MIYDMEICLDKKEGNNSEASFSTFSFDVSLHNNKFMVKNNIYVKFTFSGFFMIYCGNLNYNQIKKTSETSSLFWTWRINSHLV